MAEMNSVEKAKKYSLSVVWTPQQKSSEDSRKVLGQVGYIDCPKRVHRRLLVRSCVEDQEEQSKGRFSSTPSNCLNLVQLQTRISLETTKVDRRRVAHALYDTIFFNTCTQASNLKHVHWSSLSIHIHRAIQYKMNKIGCNRNRLRLRSNTAAAFKSAETESVAAVRQKAIKHNLVSQSQNGRRQREKQYGERLPFAGAAWRRDNDTCHLPSASTASTSLLLGSILDVLRLIFSYCDRF